MQRSASRASWEHRPQHSSAQHRPGSPVRQRYVVPFFTSLQILIKSTEEGLDVALGTFGKPHNDQQDSHARYTNMTQCSRTPKGYLPSKFFLISLGIYFELNNFDSANFCGLIYHGGTPPVAPRGIAVREDAYRLTLISYPPAKMGDGEGNAVVAALPSVKNGVLELSEQLQRIEYVYALTLSVSLIILHRCDHNPRAFINPATFAADGQVIMDTQAHVAFMARTLLLLAAFLMNQLPPAYDIHIDSDRFLSSFSYHVPDGRESVGPWANGPGYRSPGPAPQAAAAGGSAPPAHGSSTLAVDGVNLVSQIPHRTKIIKDWRLHANKLQKFIPHAVLWNKTHLVDHTGALLEEPPAPSGELDALGNIIQPGGRPSKKRTSSSQFSDS